MDETNKQQYRLAIWIQIFALVLMITGCGDAGTSNGSIRGQVFTNRSGGALTKTPEAGVSVVAVFDGEPERVRTAVSDGNGQYVIPDLPIGKYRVGFTKDGFEPVTTEKGSSRTQSAIGEGPTILYVDTGSTITAPDITLKQLAPEGDGQVIVNLIDEVTGEPVNGATVTVGEASTSNGSNGQYVLTVPIRVGDSGVPGEDRTVTVNADGYDRKSDTVIALAGQTVETTIRMSPIRGTIEGTIELSKFRSLYELGNAEVTVDGIPRSLLGLELDGASGAFSVQVPVRTVSNSRSYTIRIKLLGFFDQVVNNILGPTAGSVRVDIPPLVPETVTVVGSVTNPDTRFPAVITEAGLEGGVTGGAQICPAGTQGTFSIDGVPTNTNQELTVNITQYVCPAVGSPDPVQPAEGTATFTATNNGTGVFRTGNIVSGGGA